MILSDGCCGLLYADALQVSNLETVVVNVSTGLVNKAIACAKAIGTILGTCYESCSRL